VNAGVCDVQFGGKADRLKSGENATQWANKRTEIWASLRDCLRVGAIPGDMELRADD
jgi:hypothetical protein